MLLRITVANVTPARLARVFGDAGFDGFATEGVGYTKEFGDEPVAIYTTAFHSEAPIPGVKGQEEPDSDSGPKQTMADHALKTLKDLLTVLGETSAFTETFGKAAGRGAFTITYADGTMVPADPEPECPGCGERHEAGEGDPAALIAALLAAARGPQEPQSGPQSGQES